MADASECGDYYDSMRPLSLALFLQVRGDVFAPGRSGRIERGSFPFRSKGESGRTGFSPSPLSSAAVAEGSREEGRG